MISAMHCLLYTRIRQSLKERQKERIEKKNITSPPPPPQTEGGGGAEEEEESK